MGEKSEKRYSPVPSCAAHLTPYMNRAAELLDNFPEGAFYCRLYVAEQLNAMRSLHSDDKDFLRLLVQQVEIAEQLKSDACTTNGEEHPFSKEGFEEFCLGVFERAMYDDDNNEVTTGTMQRFYCAGLFFDVLTQFGNLRPDIEQKRKHSRWRATQIKKDIDNNIPLKPPSKSGLLEEKNPLGTTLQAEMRRMDINEPSEFKSSAKDAFLRKGSLNTEVSSDSIAAAQRLAQDAVSALSFGDTIPAKEYLKGALRLLGE